MTQLQQDTALARVRLVDATQMLAGPDAGARFGDLGADVIKVEPVGTGEFNRTHGFHDMRIQGEMSTFLAVNRNNRSIAIDLKSEGARSDRRRPLSGSSTFA